MFVYLSSRSHDSRVMRALVGHSNVHPCSDLCGVQTLGDIHSSWSKGRSEVFGDKCVGGGGGNPLLGVGMNMRTKSPISYLHREKALIE